MFTPNGQCETHALAIELMQPTDVQNPDEDNPSIIFSRLSRAEMKRVKCSELSAVIFEHYQGLKQPIPPAIIFQEGKCYITKVGLQESILKALQSDVENG